MDSTEAFKFLNDFMTAHANEKFDVVFPRLRHLLNALANELNVSAADLFTAWMDIGYKK